MRFRTKILLCMVWILALALGVGGTMLIGLSFEDSLDRERENLLQSYQITAAMMGTAMENATDSAVASIVADTFFKMQSIMDWSCCELSLDGTVLVSRGTVLASKPANLMSSQAQITIFEQRGTNAGHYIQLCAGINVGEQRLMMTLVRNITSLYETRQTMLSTFYTVFLITLSVGGLMSFAMAAALTAPLGKVSRATRQMAKGDLSARLKLRSKDEVGQLSRDFNHMANTLQENITAMEETMAAQERFMGSFAHELKTPMTSIIGYADLLRTQSLDGKDAQEAANYIFSEGKRLESLSLKLLQLLLARNESPELKPVEIDRFVIRLVHQLRPVYEQCGIRLECCTEPGRWEIDFELMQSVLTNLMDNARKALDSGGLIALMVDFPEHSCRIRVVDNGRGMPAEVLTHLTEAFYRVDKSRSRAQGGVGLGLSLCNEIVRYHGGEMKFESKPGKGTCVSVILEGGAK